jgi:hypothetical protein
MPVSEPALPLIDARMCGRDQEFKPTTADRALDAKSRHK